MKDIHDVLTEKEEELQTVTQELNALRLVARLLSEDTGDGNPVAVSGDRAQARAPKFKAFP